MKHTTCLTRDKWALALKIGCNSTKPQYNYSGEKEKEIKREPSCQDPTLAASWLLDKYVHLQLHHKQLLLLPCFGHALDWLHNQRVTRNHRQTTLGLSLACWRMCSQEQLKAKQTIKLCKAWYAIPSNSILLTAEVSLIALTFAQPRPLPSPNSLLNKPMVIASSRLRLAWRQLALPQKTTFCSQCFILPKQN